MEDVSKGRKEKGALGGTCIPVYISSTLQAFHDWQHVDKFSGWLAISCCTESVFFFFSLSFTTFFLILRFLLLLSHILSFSDIYLFFLFFSSCCIDFYTIFIFFVYSPVDLCYFFLLDFLFYFISFHFISRVVQSTFFNAIRRYRPLWERERYKDDDGPAGRQWLCLFILLTLLAHTRIFGSSTPSIAPYILPLCTHPASAGNPSSARDHANTHTHTAHTLYWHAEWE